MSEISGIYLLIRDLIDEAEKQKNERLVSSLIDIKKRVSDLEDENVSLRKQLELNDNVERHSEATYITLKNDAKKIQYCAICWGRDRKLIQLSERGCIECETRWQTALRR